MTFTRGLAALLLACSAACSGAIDVATLGTAQAVAGGEATTLTYLDTPLLSLVITLDAAADVTLSANATLIADLPSDYSSISFGAAVGYTLAVSGGANVVSAQLVTPALTAGVLAQIIGSVEARCARFDANANAYSNIEIEETTLQNQLVVDLPDVGTYVFATVAVSAALPLVTTLGANVSVASGKTSVVAFADAPGLWLNFTAGADATVSLSAELALSADVPEGYAGISFDATAGFDFAVESSAAFSAQLTTPPLSASVLAQITGSVETRCVRFDADAQAYSAVAVDELTASNQLVVQLPEAGVYAFATADVSVALPLVTTLGTDIAVASGKTTVVAFADAVGLWLNFTAGADATVSLSAELALSADVPAGYSSISFDGSAGFDFEVESAAAFTAQLTTPPLSAAVLAQITGSVETRCVRFDADAQAYSAVDVDMTTASDQVVVQLPASGVYAFATVDLTVPVPTLFGESRTTSSTESQFSYGDGVFSLVVATTTNNAVTVEHETTSQHADPPNGTSVGAFFNIDLDTEEAVTATLEYHANANASAAALAALRWAYWSTDASAWVFLDSDVEVDFDARVMAQATTHFSEWGVFDTPQGDAETSLGVAVAVQANTQTVITFSDAPAVELIVKLDSAANVTLSASASLSASLPSDYSSFSFGADLGYSFSVSGNAGVLLAQLTTPALSASVLAQLSTAVETRCVRFDADAEAYTGVDIQSQTVSNRLVVDMPQAGMYFFATAAVELPLPTLYAEARVTSSSSTKFSYPHGFVLDVATQTDNEVTVRFSTSSARDEPSNATESAAFFTIDLDHEEEVDATLSYEYDSEVELAVAQSLRFAFWSTAESSWVWLPSGASVDTSARVVSQTTTHFSEWGVFADASAGDNAAAGVGGVAVAVAAAAAAAALFV